MIHNDSFLVGEDRIMKTRNFLYRESSTGLAFFVEARSGDFPAF